MSHPHRFPRSVPLVTRAAAFVALLGLFMFAIGLFVPEPLPVILSMSVGHGLGILAFALYLLAVVLEITRRQSPPKEARIQTESADSSDEGERGTASSSPKRSDSEA